MFSAQLLTAFTWTLVGAGIVDLTPCSPSSVIRGAISHGRHTDGNTVHGHRHQEDGRTRHEPKASISCPFSWPPLPVLRWPATNATSSDCSRPTVVPCAVQAATTTSTSCKPRRARTSGPLVAAVTGTRPVGDRERMIFNIPGIVIQLHLRTPSTPPCTTGTTPCRSTTICKYNPWTRPPPPPTAPSTCTTTTTTCTETSRTPPATTPCRTTTTCQYNPWTRPPPPPPTAPSTCTTTTTTTTCTETSRTPPATTPCRSTTTCAPSTCMTKCDHWTPPSTVPDGCVSFSRVQPNPWTQYPTTDYTSGRILEPSRTSWTRPLPVVQSFTRASSTRSTPLSWTQENRHPCKTQ